VDVPQLLVKIALFLSGLLAMPMLLMHAQAYDPTALRDFRALLDSCHSPCFMDIRLGETAVRDAIVILRDHAWVRSVDEHYNQLLLQYNEAELSALSYLLRWNWGEGRPDWIGTPEGTALVVESNRVTGALIETAIPLGDALLVLSEADIGHMQAQQALIGRSWLIHDAWYPDRCLWLSAVEGTGQRFHRMALIYIASGNSAAGCGG
jgi:hypothetical protein